MAEAPTSTSAKTKAAAEAAAKARRRRWDAAAKRVRKVLDATPPPELLRDRAKRHIKRREWESALSCLDRTLVEPDDLPLGEDFVPSKESLIIRGRIQMILNQKSAALEDALAALDSLDIHDPLYSKALSLRADALFQMGRFEHALVFYYRGNRLKEGGDDVFRLGIQKAKDSIMNCLKPVRPKMRVDVTVEDTSLLPDRRTVSSVSFVFPRDALFRPRTRHQNQRHFVKRSIVHNAPNEDSQIKQEDDRRRFKKKSLLDVEESKQSSKARYPFSTAKLSPVVDNVSSKIETFAGNPILSSRGTGVGTGTGGERSSFSKPNQKKFCASAAQPFKRDINEMRRIVLRLRGERGRVSGRAAESAASEVLSYVRERNGLWAGQEDSSGRGGKGGAAGGRCCDFDRDNLPYLEQTDG